MMALYIFNFSVDTPDGQPRGVPEDLSVNDMESVVEIVLEKALNIENAIAEHDEKDNDEGTVCIIKKEVNLFFSNAYEFAQLPVEETPVVSTPEYIEPFFVEYCPENSPPPPEAQS